MPKNKTLLRLFFYLWNFWPPFFGAGIFVVSIAHDLMHARVKLKSRPWTKNIVGTQFGGSIYSMTDPIFMSMLLVHLGSEYVVWDKAASVRFRRPGKSTLFADFQISADDLAHIRTTLKTADKMDWERTVHVKDSDGEVIAEIQKIIHVSMKKRKYL